jgi:hypothetical protein
LAGNPDNGERLGPKTPVLIAWAAAGIKILPSIAAEFVVSLFVVDGRLYFLKNVFRYRFHTVISFCVFGGAS